MLRRNRLLITIGSGKLIRYGQDELLFSYFPNLSHVTWKESTDAAPKKESTSSTDGSAKRGLPSWEPIGQEPYSDWSSYPGTTSLPGQALIPWKNF